MVCLFTSIITFLIGTLPSFWIDNGTPMIVIDWITIVIFTIDYFARLIFSPNPLRFIIQPLNIVDLVSFLPFYIEVISRCAFENLMKDVRVDVCFSGFEINFRFCCFVIEGYFVCSCRSWNENCIFTSCCSYHSVCKSSSSCKIEQIFFKHSSIMKLKMKLKMKMKNEMKMTFFLIFLF